MGNVLSSPPHVFSLSRVCVSPSLSLCYMFFSVAGLANHSNTMKCTVCALVYCFTWQCRHLKCSNQTQTTRISDTRLRNRVCYCSMVLLAKWQCICCTNSMRVNENDAPGGDLSFNHEDGSAGIVFRYPDGTAVRLDFNTSTLTLSRQREVKITVCHGIRCSCGSEDWEFVSSRDRHGRGTTWKEQARLNGVRHLFHPRAEQAVLNRR